MTSVMGEGTLKPLEEEKEGDRYLEAVLSIEPQCTKKHKISHSRYRV